MAGLEALTTLIYHEKQQQGSMLCAQHALNNVLQANYFTAPVLADIARNLDTLEESYDDANNGRKSTNMDDTGFFSIQVLENALKVWDLNLVRWRSMEMRQYHDHPHTQLAFILNLQQHWFALRRFGPALPDASADPGHGHWFNLNSFLPAPEWVGKLYLGMVLHQAEEDGYSVFAITQADPNNSLALTRTEADLKASELPEPTSATTSARLSTTSTIGPTSQIASTSASKPDHIIEGFEDEDMDLQAVLQASLMGSGPDLMIPPRLARSHVPLPPDSGTHLGSAGSGSGSGTDTPIYSTRYHPYGAPGDLPQPLSHADRVAASMARNRAIMERMQREQEMAQRELYEEEIARNFRAANAERGLEQGEDDEDEDDDEDSVMTDLLSRVPAAAEGREHPHDDDGDEVDDDDVPRHTAVNWARQYRLPAQIPLGNSHSDVRVYDDDDEALQHALTASLESVPPGFVLPDLRELVPPRMPRVADTPPELVEVASDQEDMETSSETDASILSAPSSDTQQEVEEVSVDEIRRRRLARFGG